MFMTKKWRLGFTLELGRKKKEARNEPRDLDTRKEKPK
jgi:hypothetical protein